jgi:hypothetical protein
LSGSHVRHSAFANFAKSELFGEAVKDSKLGSVRGYVAGNILAAIGPVMTDSPPQDRLAEIRKQIADRLEPFCAGWPRERFDLLVDSVAGITLKYDVADPRLSYDRRTTDRLIDDLKELTRRVEESRDT